MYRIDTCGIIIITVIINNIITSIIIIIITIQTEACDRYCNSLLKFSPSYDKTSLLKLMLHSLIYDRALKQFAIASRKITETFIYFTGQVNLSLLHTCVHTT